MMAKSMTKAMITSFKKFKSAWEKDAKKPEQSIMYYLIAALNAEKDPELADAMMTVVVSKKDCLEDGRSPSGLKLNPHGAGYYLKLLKMNKNIVRSYVGGTNENDYKITKSKLKMTVVRKEEKSEKSVKIFIQSGGKDLPTPVGLKRNRDGLWKLTNYSSICTGVMPSKSEEDDF
jgi:hypothetical protein